MTSVYSAAKAGLIAVTKAAAVGAADEPTWILRGLTQLHLEFTAV